ncbi:MAG: CDP-glycerol glycerophosphotransferase family protein [Clostridia bacterium]|nr:CDP-glycerol glycerophosphotransferase family protein [Clostridia bacterium]MBQ4364756.1 CDP-glycerol glycerophosphotransferase family protein [Clostridia bacterium]MBQ6092747.1 CDP-glycerol glycerophosphotransferase family protein [Clostridia bacterium]MBR3094214.1 CDP-glycerol glycerophosphotransferase family protein [Clostridia bacterium]
MAQKDPSPQAAEQSKLLHYKQVLQSTYLYTIYLFFVRNFRKAKAGWLRFCKSVRRTFDPLYKRIVFKWVFPHVYKKHAAAPVDERKVVFVELRLPKLTNSFKVLYDTLYREYDFDLHCHFLRNTYVTRRQYRKNVKAMLADIATAKYVFFDEATNVNGCFKMRPETVVTQLWHGCGAFKKFGFSTADAIFGATRKEMEKYPFNRNYTRVTVSSPEVVWAYEEAMQYSHESGVVQPLGSSRTDIFYDQKVIDRAYRNLYALMPQAKGKKVILYAPTFRGRVARATTPRVLIPEFMKYVLGDEYVLLFKHHPLVRKRPKITDYCADFAMDVTDTMTIEDLLCVADVCISDYSSLVFEYSLFEKPMIFLAHDLEDFFDWRGFYYDYSELAPGPIVQNTTGVIDYILHLEERFDRARVHEFRRKFMSACDGHATERIMEDAFGKEALDAHRRETPLPDEMYHLIPCAADYVEVEEDDDDPDGNREPETETKEATE